MFLVFAIFTGDLVERTVMQLAVSTSSRSDASSAGSSSSISGAARYTVAETHAGDVPDIHSMATWPGVAEDLVLLQPHEARTSWREFVSTSNVIVQQVPTQDGTHTSKKHVCVMSNTRVHVVFTSGLKSVLQMSVQYATSFFVSLLALRFEWHLHGSLPVACPKNLHLLEAGVLHKQSQVSASSVYEQRITYMIWWCCY